MPYKSDKQRRYMHAKHPEIAKRWDKETGGKVDAAKKKAAVKKVAASKNAPAWVKKAAAAQAKKGATYRKAKKK